MSSNNNPIRERMQEKDTYELIQIWKANDRTEWTDSAFEIIREILVERLGELPPQSDGSDEMETETNEAETYHNPDRLISIAVWARTLSWFLLVLGFLLIMASIGVTFMTSFSSGLAITSWDTLILTLYRLVSSIVTGLVSLFFFVLLQAMAEGIYVLLDIEQNTRHRSNKDEETTQ